MAWEKFQHAKIDTVMPAKILVVDELAELLGDGSDRAQQRKAEKFMDNVQSIARLGRSGHIHLCLATQSAMGSVFPSSLKNNIAFRNICGRVEANISRMAIDDEAGITIPTAPGSYMGYAKGELQLYQGWFTKTKTILDLGTVKDGYDPETGLEAKGDDDAGDFSSLPAFEGGSNNISTIPAPSENTFVGNETQDGQMPTVEQHLQQMMQEKENEQSLTAENNQINFEDLIKDDQPQQETTTSDAQFAQQMQEERKQRREAAMNEFMANEGGNTNTESPSFNTNPNEAIPQNNSNDPVVYSVNNQHNEQPTENGQSGGFTFKINNPASTENKSTVSKDNNEKTNLDSLLDDIIS